MNFVLHIMSKPADQELYDKGKQDIYDKHPKSSAYRSSLLVQKYKRRGGEYVDKQIVTRVYNDGIRKRG